jgi:hypothetical protein
MNSLLDLITTFKICSVKLCSHLLLLEVMFEFVGVEQIKTGYTVQLLLEELVAVVDSFGLRFFLFNTSSYLLWRLLQQFASSFSHLIHT